MITVVPRWSAGRGVPAHTCIVFRCSRLVSTAARGHQGILGTRLGFAATRREPHSSRGAPPGGHSAARLRRALPGRMLGRRATPSTPMRLCRLTSARARDDCTPETGTGANRARRACRSRLNDRQEQVNLILSVVELDDGATPVTSCALLQLVEDRRNLQIDRGWGRAAEPRRGAAPEDSRRLPALPPRVRASQDRRSRESVRTPGTPRSLRRTRRRTWAPRRDPSVESSALQARPIASWSPSARLNITGVGSRLTRIGVTGASSTVRA